MAWSPKKNRSLAISKRKDAYSYSSSKLDLPDSPHPKHLHPRSVSCTIPSTLSCIDPLSLLETVGEKSCCTVIRGVVLSSPWTYYIVYIESSSGSQLSIILHNIEFSYGELGQE